MKKLSLGMSALLLAVCGIAQAQSSGTVNESPVAKVANSIPWEYGALIQGGNGLTENRDGFHFLMAGGHLGKVLTPELGHGLLKGNFEYAVEVFPFWQSYTPKFQKASCFAVPTAGTTFIGPGLLWTNHKYPAFGSNVLNLTNDGPNSDASVFNFTPQGGVGFHYFVKDRRSVDFSANAVHISSASLGDKNPGVNASVQFSLGYTWWK
jgi:lipid A 3-O-deacylase